MSEEKIEYQTTQNPEDYMCEFEKSHNQENYPDPTCYKALKHYEAEQHSEWERHHKLVGCILRVCELAGFSVENRIVLKDKRTGKIWE